MTRQFAIRLSCVLLAALLCPPAVSAQPVDDAALKLAEPDFTLKVLLNIGGDAAVPSATQYPASALRCPGVRISSRRTAR